MPLYRRNIAVLMVLVLFAGPLAQVRADHDEAHPPGVSAQAAALIDVQSGRILYEKNGDKRMLIASLTKVMTAIVAIENGNLADLVTAGKNAVGKEGSSIYLQLGEEMTLENMLYGLMLRSGNDAATAIAEHVGGSVEGFVFMMNQKAEELGMLDTHFENPHGLDAKAHYSTANDLARLTAYALKNPTFQEIVKTKVKTAPNPHDKWDYRWRNKNKMLHLYEGSDGVKTGYTKRAGRCLVSSASRGGQQLAVVTLNASSDWSDHARLLDYGFAHFPLHPIISKGEAPPHSDYVALSPFQYPLSEKERGRLAMRIEPLPEHSLDYRLGTHAHLHIALDDVPIGAVPLGRIGNEGSPSMRPATSEYDAFSWPAGIFLKWTETAKTVFQALFTMVV